MPKTVIVENRIIRMAVQAAANTPAALVASSVLQIDSFNPDIGQADSNILQFGGKFNRSTRYTNLRSGFSGVVPYMFSGTPGVAGATAVAFRACGFNQDDQADKVVYRVAAPADQDLVTADMLDDISDTEAYVAQIANGRGVLGIDWTAGDSFKFPITFLGDYERPEVTTVVEPDWGDQQTNIGDPFVPVNIENKALQLDGQMLCLVSARSSNIAGFSTSRIQTTCPSTTELANADAQIELVYQMPDLTNEFNPWELYDNARPVPFKCTAGSEAGKKMGLEIALLQAQKPVENIIDGVLFITQVFDILAEPIFTES